MVIYKQFNCKLQIQQVSETLTPNNVSSKTSWTPPPYSRTTTSPSVRELALLMVNNRFPSSIFTFHHALSVQTYTVQMSPRLSLKTSEGCSFWVFSIPVTMRGTHAPIMLLPPTDEMCRTSRVPDSYYFSPVLQR